MPLLSPGEVAQMRGAVSESLLAMTCIIQRFVPDAGPPDNYGEQTGAWQSLEALPCHWSESVGSGRAETEITGPNINVLLSKQRLVFAARTDVTTEDRVLAVLGIDGDQIAGPLLIREVLQRIAETVVVVEAQT